VALKVLPFAAALDPRQLQRFKNEAQAAAHLHHPHIVPVYYVGCERGVHFYAMQFIDGQSLAALIHQLRQRAGLQAPASAGSADPGPAPPADFATPAVAAVFTEHSSKSPAFFRTAADLGLQAALALEHAHQLGVLHRDVKPANLLVDARGHLWVTDFGLARFHGEAGLTLSGDLVGTLRYMSPEQALAQRGLVDQRSDVYSLGVTLYELLTLEPAWKGTDRQELLRQLEREEPRSPRALNRAVPKDLETIVLKATAKKPASRYATAQELADDLRRFLEDRPVRARRPTPLQRLARWSRRHRAVVGAAVLLLLVAVAGLAVSNVLIRREQARAEAQWQQAEANYHEARDAVDQMLAEVGHKWLADVPMMELVRRKLLERALAFYEGFLEERGSDPDLRQETGRAHGRVGEIRDLLGEHARGEQAYRAALEVQARLAAEHPDVPAYRRDLAVTHHNLGTLLRTTGRGPEAEGAYRQALDLREKLVADFPGVPTSRRDLASNHNSLGNVLQDAGRLREAKGAYDRALALQEELAAAFPAVPAFRQDLARSHNNRGIMLQETGRRREAEGAYRRALDLREKLVADAPAVPAFRQDLAQSHHSLGVLLQEAGRLPKAEAACRRALALREKLAAAFPAVPAYRHELASSHNILGNWLQQQPGRGSEAEGAYRQALDLWGKLAAEFPAVPAFRQDLARTHTNLGILLQKAGRLPEAKGAFDQALALRKKLAADHPGVPAYRLGLARSHLSLGHLSEETDPPRAELDYGGARELYEKLATDHPTVPAYRQELAHTHHNLGALLQKTGRLSEAVKACRRARDLQEKLADEFPGVPAYSQEVAQSHHALGGLLQQAGQLREAIEAYRRALKGAPDDAEVQNELAWLLATCPAPEWRDAPQAVGLAQKAVARASGNGAFWKTLGVAQCRAGDWPAAVAALEKSMQLRQGGDASDWFFLAVAHGQSGAKDKARHWYDRAVRWTQQNRSKDEELGRFRAEAAALLGLREPLPAPAQEPPEK
jgi:tetratricopeptide (TPR) repeat protein